MRDGDDEVAGVRRVQMLRRTQRRWHHVAYGYALERVVAEDIVACARLAVREQSPG